MNNIFDILKIMELFRLSLLYNKIERERSNKHTLREKRERSKKMDWKRGILAAAVFGTALCGRDVKGAENPLRAVIFYQSQIWVQDINIMYQIADSIKENLGDSEDVALSAYRIENMEMSELIQAAVNMQTDVVLYYGIDSEKAMENYEILAEHGIRLILVDGDVEESGRYAYIGTDNYGAGVQAADFIAENWAENTSVAALAPVFDTSLCSVGARLEGFKEEMKEKKLDIAAYCETSYNSLTAITEIEKLLDEQPDLTVLYCTEAVSGQAAADVVAERGLEDQLTVITYDINQRIEKDLMEGNLDLTFSQDIDRIGKSCAETLLELANDRDKESGEDVLFSCIPVKKEDLENSENEK